MIDEHIKLLQFTKILGPAYGTEDSAIFLYSLVKMHRPRVILELGTGLGVCAFQMAMAAKENDYGCVFTVDNGGHWEGTGALVQQHQIVPPGTDYPNYLDTVAEWLDVKPFVTFMNQTMPPLPELDEPIDLLFSDFAHGPEDTLRLMAFYLPRLSECSSIFIDGASTLRQTYELLEALIPQLNAGTVPDSLRQFVSDNGRNAFDDLVGMRRFTLMHLTEVKQRSQNSMAWIKIEPRDGGPFPATSMREL
jgi:hypothetical protein